MAKLNGPGISKLTNREVVHAFRSHVGDKVRLSDDNGWSVRRIFFFLLRYRAKIIAEKLRGNRILSVYNYQTIPCIPLIEVDQNECPCAPAKGCTFLRTKLAVPKPIYNFKAVTSIDGAINYSYVEWDKFNYKINSRIKAQAETPYYTTKTSPSGTYIYVYNDVHKEFVTTTAIHENPIEVQVFPDCEGNVDYCTRILDLEFIIDPDLLMTIYDLAFERLLKTKGQTSDIVSQDQDDTSKNQNPLK